MLLALPALASSQSGVGGEKVRRERLQERSVAASPLDQEVQRLTDSVLTLLEKERVIVRAMRETPIRSDSARRARRGLERQLNAVSLQNMRMQSRLRSLCNRAGQPDGWMGITFSGEYHLMSQAPLTLRFMEYPRIEAVDPASPAAAAGLEIGDTIVALGGEDLREQVVQFAMLLRPGSLLPATVRRNGEVRALRMKVERRPMAMDGRCNEVSAALAAAMANPVIDVIRLENGYIYRTPAPAAPMGMMTPPTSAMAPEAVTTPLPPRIWINTGSSARVLAGAEVAVPDRETLTDVLGASHGLLVTRVLQGSPAERAGLRSFDVIMSADGEKILSPGGLAKAMADADQRDELELGVWRKRKLVTVTLKWLNDRD